MFIRVSGRCEGGGPFHSLGRAFVRAYVEILDYKYVFMILHYYIFIFDAIITKLFPQHRHILLMVVSQAVFDCLLLCTDPPGIIVTACS